MLFDAHNINKMQLIYIFLADHNTTRYFIFSFSIFCRKVKLDAVFVLNAIILDFGKKPCPMRWGDLDGQRNVKW